MTYRLLTYLSRFTSFFNVTGITDNGVSKLAQGLCTYLKVLDLVGCQQIGDFGDRGLKEIGSNCCNLRELYYSNARRIEDAGIHAIVAGCPYLEVLALAGLHNMTKKGLKSLCKYSSKLKVRPVSSALIDLRV